MGEYKNSICLVYKGAEHGIIKQSTSLYLIEYTYLHSINVNILKQIQEGRHHTSYSLILLYNNSKSVKVILINDQV